MGAGPEDTLAAGDTVGFELPCPQGKQPISGGFVTESELVFLNSSFPGEAPGTWQVWVTNTGDQEAAWMALVTCG